MLTDFLVNLAAGLTQTFFEINADELAKAIVNPQRTELKRAFTNAFTSMLEDAARNMRAMQGEVSSADMEDIAAVVSEMLKQEAINSALFELAATRQPLYTELIQRRFEAVGGPERLRYVTFELWRSFGVLQERLTEELDTAARDTDSALFNWWSVNQLRDIQREQRKQARLIERLAAVSLLENVTAADVLEACREQVEYSVFEARQKYHRGRYIHRDIEHEINDFFDNRYSQGDANCYLIVAPAGSGKTNLLCQLALERVNRQPVLLLLGGSLYLGGTTGFLRTFENELNEMNPNLRLSRSADALHTLQRLAAELDQDILVLIDAINEYERPAVMRKALQHLLKKTHRRRIKLLVTCRDFYWKVFQGAYWQGAVANGLPSEGEVEEETDDFARYTAEEHEQALAVYFSHYEILGYLAGEALKQCRHPLLLQFFCEAHKGKDIGEGEIENIRLKDLFDEYWNQKLESIAVRRQIQGDDRTFDGHVTEVEDYLLSIAQFMLQNDVRALSPRQINQASGRTEDMADPKSIYGRVRDEFIILEERERIAGKHKRIQIAFVYEEFMEYAMARSLMNSWGDLDESGVLAEIEYLTGKYKHFAQITGVMVYLAIMLREDRDIALWSLLLNRGPQWQDTIFEAFRKLPDDQLKEDFYEVLNDFLCSGNDTLLIHTLDLLKIRRIGERAESPTHSLIVNLVTDARERIAKRAVLVCENFPHAISIPACICAFEHQDRNVRQNARNVLNRLGDLRCLRWTPTNTMDVLRFLLVRGNVWACRYWIDDSVPSTVRDAITGGNPPAAPKILHSIVDVHAAEPFINALMDDNAMIRQEAATALGKIADARAVEPLINALIDDNHRVRKQAVIALGNIADPYAVEPLVRILKEYDNRVGKLACIIRKQVVIALGNIADPRVEKPLVNALTDKDRGVRREANKSLNKFYRSSTDESKITAHEDEKIIPFSTDDSSHDDHSLTLLKATIGEDFCIGDPSTVELLITELRRPESILHQEIVIALGYTSDPRVVEPLIHALIDEDPFVREQAAIALGSMSDSRAVEPLINAFEDKNPFVREQAVLALVNIADENTVNALHHLLVDEKRTTRQAAIVCLNHVEPDFIQSLRGIVLDGGHLEKLCASDLLGLLDKYEHTKKLD